MIPFSKPPYTGAEDKYVLEAIHSNKLSGDGAFTQRCHRWFDHHLLSKKALLTPSCTAALEMAAMLIDIQSGDEVIMPSYTFVSTANAFVLRGAIIVFVDINPDTMNIDASKIEAAITAKTKAIVPVHYAGVSCDMDAIMHIADNHSLFVIEDAAQGMMSTYKNKALGTIGHIGTYSFHDTKNYTSGGEGGLLILNDAQFVNLAEIIREKGTNRKQFLEGLVDKYSWVNVGSSYLPSEIQAAYLWGQLDMHQEINQDRLTSWAYYYEKLTSLQNASKINLPVIPTSCQHNAHMFYIKVADKTVRPHLIEHLKDKAIWAVFHYIPLHTTIAGKSFSRFNDIDQYTTIESQKIIRLPLWYGITKQDLDKVIDNIYSFYQD